MRRRRRFGANVHRKPDMHNPVRSDKLFNQQRHDVLQQFRLHKRMFNALCCEYRVHNSVRGNRVFERQRLDLLQRFRLLQLMWCYWLPFFEEAVHGK